MFIRFLNLLVEINKDDDYNAGAYSVVLRYTIRHSVDRSVMNASFRGKVARHTTRSSISSA